MWTCLRYRTLCEEGNQLRVTDSLIDKQRDLDRFVGEITDFVGLDTEFYFRRTFFRVPCLLQLATHSKVCAVDLLAPLNLKSIEMLLRDSKIRKVMHASGEDMKLFYYLFGEMPSNVVDTQLACEFVTLEEQPPYKRLVGEFLGIDLSKSSSITTSDWQLRPLSSEQLHYALDDVRYLLPLWEALASKLQSLGREDWFHEEMRSYLADQSRSMSDGIPGVSGVGNLSQKDRALARILAGWRERVARRSNVPRQWVARDDQLVATLRNRKNSGEYFRKQFGNKLGATLHKSMKRAKNDLARGSLSSAIRNEYPWSIKQGQTLSRRLREIVQKHSERLQISRVLLASQNNMLDWSSSYLKAGVFPPSFGGWRENLLGKEFKQALEDLR